MGESGYDVNPGGCPTMTDSTGCETMPKKPGPKKSSETRRHTGMMRVRPEVLAKAKKVASLMEVSLADYVSDALEKMVDRDMEREVKKLTKGGKDE